MVLWRGYFRLVRRDARFYAHHVEVRECARVSFAEHRCDVPRTTRARILGLRHGARKILRPDAPAGNNPAIEPCASHRALRTRVLTRAPRHAGRWYSACS